MTTSTVKTEANPAPKKKKAKGPIRFELIIPVFIFLALIIGYFKFFFDSHLKSAIEIFGSRMHGAEINVGDIKTSFLDLTLQVSKVQITHKADPALNIFAFDQLEFKLLLDALLRAKFVVDNSSLEGINWLSKRARPGKIYPPEKSESGALTAAKEQVLTSVKKRAEGSALGDIADILGGVDPKDQLESIRGELESEKKIKALEAELKEREKMWKERIEKISDKKELDSIKERARSYKFDKKDPIGSVKKANDLIKDAKNKVKAIESASKDLKSDIKKYGSVLESVDNWVEEDIKALEKKAGIPDINLENVGLDVIAGLIGVNVAEFRKYVELAREYMPPKKTAEQKAEGKLIPPARSEGINYRFPITTGYPTWWLKNMSLTSSGKGGDYSGELTGSLTHLSSNPEITKMPTTFQATGDFARQQIMGVNLKVILDHTKVPAKDSLTLNVASAPLKKISFASSEKLTVAIDQGQVRNAFSASVIGEQVKVNYAAEIESPKWVVESNKKEIQNNLTPILTGISSVDLKAGANGTWDDLNWSLRSNLGPEIAKGVRQQIDVKIKEARAKVEKVIREKIGPQKEKIKGEITKVQNDINSLLGKTEGDAKNVVEGITKDITGKSKGGVAGKADQALDKLKKKLKLKL